MPAPAAPTGFWKRYTSLPRNVLALSFVSFLNDTSSEIIYPLLPAFLALSLGASPFAIGLIEGFAESVASLLKLVSGYLSDRFGTRKTPVLAGYSLGQADLLPANVVNTEGTTVKRNILDCANA